MYESCDDDVNTLIQLLKSKDMKDSEVIIAIVHCISEDLKMTKGFANAIRSYFGRPILYGPSKDSTFINKTILQEIKLNTNTLLVYHMLTKERYFHKPTNDTILNALNDVRLDLNHRVERRKMIPNAIFMPSIGLGLDAKKLTFSEITQRARKVKYGILEILKSANIPIYVYGNEKDILFTID